MYPSEQNKDVFIDLDRGLPVSDCRFDAVYPAAIRSVSYLHWTSVNVARRAAELLGSDAKVLDVGSGVGKFCMVGSLSTAGTFTGIERRAHLVEVSRDIIKRYNLQRVTFVTGELKDIDWKAFNAFYLFNPFIENLYQPTDWIDHSVELSRDRYIADIRFVQKRLHEAPSGTRVVTYHGFGGEFPPGYQVKAIERWGDDALMLRIKE